MTPDDPLTKRRILQAAEAAFGDPEAEAALAEQGIFLSDTETMSGPELLAALGEDEPDVPSITITAFFDDSPSCDRREVEDRLSDLAEQSGIGEWAGSGLGEIDGRQFFDVRFIVRDEAAALESFQAWLRELQLGPATELATSDGSTRLLG